MKISRWLTAACGLAVMTAAAWGTASRAPMAVETAAAEGPASSAAPAQSEPLPGGWVRFAGDAAEPMVLLPDVSQSATHIEFRHAFVPGEALRDWRLAVALSQRKIEVPPTAPTLFCYRVTFSDGETLDIPVRFGESIHDWKRVQTVGPMLWAEADEIREPDTASGEMTVTYCMSWPNPRPEKTIASIAVVPQQLPHLNFGDALIGDVRLLSREPTGKSYYVDPTLLGSDDQPGTYDEPFGTVQKAAEVVKPGDTVYLRRGYYALNRQIEFKDWGYEEGKWLTISAFPGETPVLDGFGILADPRMKPHNLEGTNKPPYQHDAGVIHVHNFKGYVRVQGLFIQRSPIAGISVYGQFRSNAFDDAEHARFVEVQFNTTDRCNEMGIITHYCDDLRVIGNRVCRPHSEQMVFTVPDGLPMNKVHHGQEGIDLSRNKRFEVAFNEVYGGGKEAIDCISVQHGRVHHNYVHSSLNGIYIDSWSEPIEDVELDHNYIHNAFSGIPCSTEGSNKLLDFRIHHNIVFESKSGGISITEATYKSKPAEVRNHLIDFNTIDRSGYHAEAINWFTAGIGVAGFPDNPDFGNITVENNIVTRSAHMPLRTPWKDPASRDIFVRNNLFWPARDTVPERQKDNDTYARFIMQLGDDWIDADPLYADPARGDFRLSENSPARGAGRNGEDLGALPYGSAWQQGRDFMGAITAYFDAGRETQPVYIHPSKCTQHRNHLQRPSWFQTGRYGSDLQHLPAGKHSWGGVTWFIPEDDHNDEPTVLTLSGFGFEGKVDRIDGIEVGRRADGLAFLHTFHPGPGLKNGKNTGLAAEVILFEYIIHYADGSSATVPVKWNVNISDWRNRLANLPEARLVWTTPIESRSGRIDAHTALYSYEWKNPKPDQEVESIDLVKTAPWDCGAPAVLAISSVADR